ncbi:MAG: threonine synthase [Lachnospiraceae bacterium]|nr:threonine synthase [Lachnospiraceae bacterium]
MSLFYKSTRNSENQVSASQAILKGLSDDGGLFVPSEFPKLQLSLTDISKMSYKETAYEVMKLFLNDFTEEELKNCIENAYDSKFDTENICELVNVGDVNYLELYHGATIAFKDMALSILPHLLTTSAKKNNIQNKIVILTATSGDTGKAAMAGFADVPGTEIIVFYPKGGVSRVQEKQMLSQTGANTHVVGITGNFDDAQTGVKEMFNNKDLEERLLSKGIQFSSANSINIGRLVPQVVYYVFAYSRLIKEGRIQDGDKVNFVVPTGNFGNILAAFYAKQLGVPVNKLICASNENKVLFDFFETGIYDRMRDFILTTSPSMDILISSNLERLIYLLTGEDSSVTADMMNSLKANGKYELKPEMKAGLADFIGGWSNEERVAKEIHDVYENEKYVMDTHTAVASAVYHDYKAKTGDDTVTVIASTASPYKFATAVMGAIDPKYVGVDDFKLIDELNKVAGITIPKAVDGLLEAPVLHNTVCETADMQKTVEGILGL